MAHQCAFSATPAAGGFADSVKGGLEFAPGLSALQPRLAYAQLGDS